MMKFLKTWRIPLLTLLSGVIAALLQLWCLSTEDSKGLLLRGHISQHLSWIFTALVLGALFFFTQPLKQAPKYSFNFPVSLLSAVGSTVGAVGILLSGAPLLLSRQDTLTTVTAIFSLLAAFCLVLSGFGRLKNRDFTVLPHCAVCIWLLLLLICQYRHWSAQPQFQLYAYQLLATVFLMIGSFQRACFHAGMGNRQSYTFFRLAGAYFCLAALPGSEFWMLYTCAAFWSLTDLCNLTPMPKGR